MFPSIPADVSHLSQAKLAEIRPHNHTQKQPLQPEKLIFIVDQRTEKFTELDLKKYSISPTLVLQAYAQTQPLVTESAVIDGKLLAPTPVPAIAETPTVFNQQSEFGTQELTSTDHTFFPVTSISAAAQLKPAANSQADQPLSRSRLTQLEQSSTAPKATSNLPLVIKRNDLASSYKKPPQVIPDQKVNPFITTFRLNGSMISHLTRWEIAGGYNFGNSISSNLNINGIYRSDSKITQSLSNDNVFTSEQTGTYLQVQTVKTRREFSILREVPQTLQGVQLQLTFLGSCSGINNAAQLCSLTPTLITDKTSIDPKFLFPTRILQDGTVGEAVSPETLSDVSQPGYQSGGNGKQVGIDLYFPNIGALPGNAQTNQTSIIRKESVETTPVFTISRVRQIIKANHNRAVLGRTIRGFPLIPLDQNQGLNLAVQLAAEVLPDVEPQIEGTLEAASTNINKNLFFASNNIRIPENSFTIYQAGLGSAVHPHKQDQKVITPSASFNSIWLGLSPVTTLSQGQDLLYKPTSAERVIVTTGGEGGRSSNNAFSSTVNGKTFSSAELSDFYTQIYITFFSRDVNFITETTTIEKTKYYPHLSLSGNITSSDAIFRYYGGVIAANSPRFYVGADYTKFLKTWTFNLEGVFYNHSDQNYYSHISGAISKTFPISSKANLVLSSAFNYAFGRDETQLGIFPVNFFTIGGRVNWGPLSVGITKFLQVLPYSVDSLLTADIGIQLGKQGRLSAFWAPGRTTDNYGIVAQYRFGDGYNSPTIGLSWSRENYSLGLDQFNQPLSGNNNTFAIFFRLGAPAKPF